MNKLILCEGATDAISMQSCSATIWNEQQDGSLFVNRRRAYPFEQQNKMKKSHGIKRTTTIC